MRGVLLILAMGIGTAGCNGDCVEVNRSCAAAYDPTFDNVYTNTLQVSCAVGNGTCHTADGQNVAAGLSFETVDEAFAGLTGADERTISGDPECSLIVQRIESTEADTVMPPGDMLREAERCAVTQWIANGTPR